MSPRVLVAVLDGVGVGALPDAGAWGDADANTLRNVLRAASPRLPNLAAFGLLFAASGIGNGSTFRMISSLFVAERLKKADELPSARAQAAREGAVEAAAALGFASAIGAYGGFFIPKSVGSSLAITGSASAALVMFIGFYLSCIALTWWAYSRRNAPYPC